MWGPPLLQKRYSQLSPKPVTFHEENLCDIRGISSWSSWPSCFPWKVVRAMLFFVVFPGWQMPLQTGQCPADWTLLYHGMKRCYTLLSWLGPGHQVLQSPGYTICKEFLPVQESDISVRVHPSETSLLFHLTGCLMNHIFPYQINCTKRRETNQNLSRQAGWRRTTPCCPAGAWSFCLSHAWQPTEPHTGLWWWLCWGSCGHSCWQHSAGTGSFLQECLFSEILSDLLSSLAQQWFPFFSL